MKGQSLRVRNRKALEAAAELRAEIKAIMGAYSTIGPRMTAKAILRGLSRPWSLRTIQAHMREIRCTSPSANPP
jgi:hypothetical protein